MERMVHPGEFYRHFKNKLYQVITVASHSETGEQMVVYQALYGDFQTYVRPLEMFLGEVDRGKYPQAGQTYRFEQVLLAQKEQAAEEAVARSNPAEPGMQEEERAAAPQKPHPGLLRFLEAGTYEERMACFPELEKTAGQAELDSIYVVLDMKPQAGTIMEQLEGIRHYLNVQKYYDGGHLR